MANKYDDDYTRVNWENLPSYNTPINQQNLNKMDAQIKTLTTRVSDMSTYVPNVMYVDELPEQGVEGLLYVTALIEHGITLDGELPDHFKSQSALDSWINDGNYAFMLHLRNVDEETNGDAYVIIENITVENFSMVPNFYTVQTIESGAGSNFYLYLTKDRTWYEQSFNGLEVGDKLVAVPLADNTNTKIGNEWYANTGDIFLGIENIMGNITLLNHYTSADNTYEIYQAKPIRVLDPRNVYMWNDDTHSFFGFQKEYENGNGIVFTNQGTKVIISTDTTVLQEKLIAGQNIRIVGNVISATGGGGGGSYTEGFGIDIDSNDIISVDTSVIQTKLTAGQGITIASDGTISVNYPNGDTIEY